MKLKIKRTDNSEHCERMTCPAEIDDLSADAKRRQAAQRGDCPDSGSYMYYKPDTRSHSTPVIHKPNSCDSNAAQEREEQTFLKRANERERNRSARNSQHHGDAPAAWDCFAVRASLIRQVEHALRQGEPAYSSCQERRHYERSNADQGSLRYAFEEAQGRLPRARTGLDRRIPAELRTKTSPASGTGEQPPRSG
jgi:hypothetical protein